MTDADIQMLKDLIPFLIPIFIIQVILWVVALVDLAKREKVKGGSKVVWVIVIILLEILGPILYLVWGRHVEEKESANGSGDKD
jgi:hypothetical protein